MFSSQRPVKIAFRAGTGNISAERMGRKLFPRPVIQQIRGNRDRRLRQFQSLIAEILGLSDVIGEIRNGLCADLALFCGNPDEDFTVIYDRPAHVWKCGELVR